MLITFDFVFLFLIAAVIALIGASYAALSYRRNYKNAFFLLTQWREWGRHLSLLYPDIYAELNDHRYGGERWDMRKIRQAADALEKDPLAKLDK